MGKPERIYPGEMPARQNPKREAKMRQIIRQLRITPIPQIACERAGISRATYYRWRANDFVFARAADHVLEEGRFLVSDMAESQLVRAIKNGESWAIRYWLSHNHPRYARQDIHEHCHYCETKSTEEKHREEKRISLTSRTRQKVHVEMMEKIVGSIEDRHERQAHGEEDLMFERFEMLDDDTETAGEETATSENT